MNTQVFVVLLGLLAYITLSWAGFGLGPVFTEFQKLTAKAWQMAEDLKESLRLDYEAIEKRR